MNSLENDIYNNGTICGRSIYHTELGDLITEETVKYYGILYSFTFYNGELSNCRKY